MFTNVAMRASLAASYFEHIIPSYLNMGEDWSETVEGADLCSTGLLQSPIDLNNVGNTDATNMELNGYGYLDYPATREDFTLPTYMTHYSNGEFILI